MLFCHQTSREARADYSGALEDISALLASMSSSLSSLKLTKLKKFWRQHGQSSFTMSHGKTQSRWKKWLQLLLCDVQTFSPMQNLSRQIAQCSLEASSPSLLVDVAFLKLFSSLFVPTNFSFFKTFSRNSFLSLGDMALMASKEASFDDLS